MEIITSNWPILVGLAAVIAGAVLAAKKFLSLTGEQQLSNVKSWLLWAVTQAEKELGAGTGRLKLAMVYDMFVSKFPAVAKVLTFETFSSLVDDALEEMQKMLESNRAIAKLVAIRE